LDGWEQDRSFPNQEEWIKLGNVLNSPLTRRFFSPDGTRLVTGNGAGVEALKLWDTDSWQDVITLQGSGSVFYEPAFSPDGNSVGALSEAGILHVWRAPSWAEIEKAEASDNQSTTP
jgi:WD40 repeat protein